MNIESKTVKMNEDQKSGTATYCPEDNKLRLYVGRVPRDEYEKLRADGWTSTPKQACDFVATWTPSRRDTCLEYADTIEDEDQTPEERAADRAERFGGYLDKRIDEATDHAGAYESGPAVHGYQSQARAERSAARHDRIASRSVDAWDKAEYWQRRTAGVIRHALYVCRPDVRMGRIKELEAQLRKIEASHNKAHAEHSARHAVLLSIVEHAEGRREKMTSFPGWQYSMAYIREADKLAEDATFTPEQLRRCMVSAVFAGECDGRWSDLRKQVKAGEIEAATVAREWLDADGLETPLPPDFAKSEWHKHLTLRIAYENQMLEAQGGRLAHVEIEPGGKIGGKLIVKVNKSPATGRVTSVSLKGPKVQGWTYKAENAPGTDYALYQFDTERMAPGAYTPPTDESRAELAALKKEKKASAPKKDPCPLVNPTDEDAERLQAAWNERARDKHETRNTWTSESARAAHSAEFKPAQVVRITQATYSANSGGTYSKAETIGLCRDMRRELASWNMYSAERDAKRKAMGPPVCKVRVTGHSIIVLTDKPQKALPAAVWALPLPVTETVAA